MRVGFGRDRSAAVNCDALGRRVAAQAFGPDFVSVLRFFMAVFEVTDEAAAANPQQDHSWFRRAHHSILPRDA